MSLQKRIERLEDSIPEGEEVLLFTKNGDRVDGTITRKPTADQPGEAQMADGTVRPIEYEKNWQSSRVIVSYKYEQGPDTILRMRCGKVTCVIFVGIPEGHFQKGNDDTKRSVDSESGNTNTEA